MIEIFSKRIEEIKSKDNITIKLLMDVSRTFGCENAIQFMQGLFHKEVNKYLLKVCSICEENKITKNDIMLLAQNIQNLKFNVCGTYDNNQINCGGIELESLTENLMSKTIDGLYFAGEVVDVDGICGGYNLQWCWTSGKIVGDINEILPKLAGEE